ncbi:MAG: DNA translocase FtsK 4TM domain-containing protein, partial [Pikeienuella sp.]
MARSWTEGERAPLLPPSAQAFLKRRGAELTGFGFLVVGLALFAALASYHPEDPSWLNATSSAPRNWLGAPGALLADPLLQTLGLAAWGLPTLLIVWAFRLVLHRGDERAWSRMILACVAIPVAAVFASTHAPFEGWTALAGLGGAIGDGVLSMLLSLAPMAPAEAVKPLSLILAAATLLLAGLSLGLNWAETVAGFRFLIRSLIEAVVWLIAHSSRLFGFAAGAARERMARPRSEKHAPPAPLGLKRREPSMDGFDDDDDEGDIPPLENDGVLPSILRRAPQPVERPAPKPRKKSRAAVAQEQPSLAHDEEAGEEFLPPALSLLQSPTKIVRHRESDAALDQNARMLESVLDDYGVRGEIGAIRPGPVVTMYELEPAPGLKASRVIGLSDDIA